MPAISNGWYDEAEHSPSPYFNARPDPNDISLIVIHNISLPPGEFGGPYITDLFTGRLQPEVHPYFQSIYQLEVSAHCLISRTGHVTQYVSFADRAWHAGVSQYQGREKCNDFSIGIELEGTDDQAYTCSQYQALVSLVKTLFYTYPKTSAQHITGHCDIAPGRKTDPGSSFDWQAFRNLLNNDTQTNTETEKP